MAVTSAQAPGPDRPQLRRGALGLLDATVIAVSSTAPAYSIATAMAALGAAVALQAPAAVIVGFLPVMGIAIAFWALNRKDPNCGASYSWVGGTLGRNAGYFNGWMVLVTDVLFMAFAAPQAGQATLQLVNTAGAHSLLGLNLDAGDHTASVVVGVAILAMVTWMVVVGIKLAARFQWLLLALEYSIVVGFAIAGLFHGGGSPVSWNWLNPLALGGIGGVAAGVVIAVFFYWGWDTSANVNEEIADAEEDPGRAGMLGMVALLGIFLLAAISIQHVLTPEELQANGSTTLTFFASKLVGQPLASLAVLALISSTVATLQTTLLPSARTAFSMGRDGALGGMWARVHPRYRTPWLGTIVFGVASAALAMTSLRIGGFNAVVSAGVTSIGVLVAYYYGMAGVACAVRYLRDGERRPGWLLLTVVIPAVSAAALWALAGYYVVTSWRAADSISFDATNGRFLVVVPLVLMVAGVPALLWSRVRTGHRRSQPPAPEQPAPPAESVLVPEA